jgi:flagellar motility protein MotE (MotC chaperone)
MFSILLGTWTRRGVTVVICLISFVVGLTGALATTVRKSPDFRGQVIGIPVVGQVAVMLSGVKAPDAGTVEEEELGRSYVREHPLSAEEIAQLIQDLKQQRQALRARATELTREQKRLALHRQDLLKERKEIDSLRTQITSEWDAIKKARESIGERMAVMNSDEGKNLKKLAKTYESMKPDRAAAALGQLDEATVAKILYLMRDRSVGKIMGALEADKAASLTIKMQNLKRL